MIFFISFEKAYMPLSSSDWLYLSPFPRYGHLYSAAWNFSLKISAKPLQMKTCSWCLLLTAIGNRQHPIRWYHCPLSTTYCLATIPHAIDIPWVTQSQWFSCHLKANMRFLLAIYSNLGPISYRLATIHPWRTDKQTTDDTSCHKRSTAYTSK